MSNDIFSALSKDFFEEFFFHERTRREQNVSVSIASANSTLLLISSLWTIQILVDTFIFRISTEKIVNIVIFSLILLLPFLSLIFSLFLKKFLKVRLQQLGESIVISMKLEYILGLREPVPNKFKIFPDDKHLLPERYFKDRSYFNFNNSDEWIRKHYSKLINPITLWLRLSVSAVIISFILLFLQILFFAYICIL